MCAYLLAAGVCVLLVILYIGYRNLDDLERSVRELEHQMESRAGSVVNNPDHGLKQRVSALEVQMANQVKIAQNAHQIDENLTRMIERLAGKPVAQNPQQIDEPITRIRKYSAGESIAPITTDILVIDETNNSETFTESDLGALSALSVNMEYAFREQAQFVPEQKAALDKVVRYLEHQFRAAK